MIRYAFGADLPPVGPPELSEISPWEIGEATAERAARRLLADGVLDFGEAVAGVGLQPLPVALAVHREPGCRRAIATLMLPPLLPLDAPGGIWRYAFWGIPATKADRWSGGWRVARSVSRRYSNKSWQVCHHTGDLPDPEQLDRRELSRALHSKRFRAAVSGGALLPDDRVRLNGRPHPIPLDA